MIDVNWLLGTWELGAIVEIGGDKKVFKTEF